MEPKNRLNEDEHQLQVNIDRVRARGHRLTDEVVTLAHGAGGKASAALVDHVFFPVFGNELLNPAEDAAVFELPAGKVAMSTDSYVVNPIEFPGGSIGDLAVNGTCNDLAVSGAVPRVISAAFVLEEGLEITTLRRIVADMHAAAESAGVVIATGDTKVVPKGACDKLYITTAGIGVIPAERTLGAQDVAVGDKIILSGAIADHGMAVMMARGDLAIHAPIESDTRSISPLVEAVYAAAPQTRWLRDATRGGLATVLNELARSAGVAAHLQESAIPVQEMTAAACEMLGIDPLYVANEGTFIAVVPADQAAAAEAALQAAGAPAARIVGEILAAPAGGVILETGFGGTRMVDMLVGDPLPRIC